MTGADLIFAKYEIQHRIAIGGMGEVFYAVQTGIPGFERPVILKSLLPDLAVQEGFIDQFLDEARVAATLNHPNVVSIYEVGLWNGTYFIAMEYIRGRNLAQLLRRTVEQQVAMPTTVASRIIVDAAQGLDHAHRATDTAGTPLNIVHRDISPQNIMLREDGVTKVVDFGIARAANRASARTATGTLKGKLAYMAPEQILGRAVSPLMDQFSLGVCFWELLTQRRLFKADSDIALAKAVLEAPIPPPSELRPEVPRALDAVVARMLSRDPERRFASCAEVSETLGELLVSSRTAAITPAAFMRRLGTDDLTLKARAPSNSKNFVISLSPSAEDPAGPAAVYAGSIPVTPSERIRLDDLALPRVPRAATPEPVPLTGAGTVPPPLPRPAVSGAEPSREVEPPPRAGKRWTLPAVLLGATGVVVLAVAGGLSLWPRPPAPPELAVPVAEAPVEGPAMERAPEDPPPPVVEAVRPAADAPVAVPLKTTPAGATVRLDGKVLGTTPLQLELTDPVHYLLVEKAGFQRVERELHRQDLEGGKELKLRLVSSLVQRAAAVGTAAGAGTGYLSLDTTPWSKVYIDGQYEGSTPLFKKRLAAGRHTLVFINEGESIRRTYTVEVEAEKTTKRTLNLTSER